MGMGPLFWKREGNVAVYCNVQWAVSGDGGIEGDVKNDYLA